MNGFITVKQTAERLGIHKNTVYAMLKDRVLTGYKVGRARWRIKEEELNAYINEHSNKEE